MNIYKLLPFLFFFFVAVSCYENDRFSTNENLNIQFSNEQLPFDTIFLNIVSPLKTLKIYNNNNESIVINSVSLNKKSDSPFRINVNGRPGFEVNDIELLKKDSIYLFVETKTNQNIAESENIDDLLLVEWNGNKKSIPISGLLKEVDIFESLVVDRDLSLDKDIYLKGDLIVKSGVVLSIEKGVTVYSGLNSYFLVNGTLLVNGTIAEPVVLRGNNLNKSSDNILFDNHTSQWGGIKFTKSSFGNTLENVVIKNSKGAIDIEPSDNKDSKLILYNTIIHNPLYFGVKSINSRVGIYNSQITNSYGPLLQIVGGNVQVIHSTIANYFQWYQRGAASVEISDTFEGTEYVLSELSVINSLIVGSRRKELNILGNISDNVLFRNNLIQVQEIPTSPWFLSCYWNLDSPFVFENLNLNKDYSYSFQLSPSSNSNVLQHSDVEMSKLFPLDLNGKPRVGPSDIGCYQHKW